MPVCKCGELTTEQTCERCQRLIEQELHKIRERMSEALNEGTQYPQEPDELATLRTENERLQSRVAELEAAQTPRRIEDAPRDTWVLAKHKRLGVIEAMLSSEMLNSGNPDYLKWPWESPASPDAWLFTNDIEGFKPLPPAKTEDAE